MPTASADENRGRERAPKQGARSRRTRPHAVERRPRLPQLLGSPPNGGRLRRSAGGERVCAFLEGWTETLEDGRELWHEGQIRQSKGRWAGQRLELEPFERALIHELFRTDSDGRRVYIEALLGLPRKNGKTTLLAAIGLYLLTSDGEQGGEVYAAAASKGQARALFNEAKKMVEQSPYLSAVCRVRRDVIEHPGSGSIFRVLSSDAPLQHGLNPSAVLIDELHAHRSRELYDTLTTGSGAREQPLFVTITTAGYDRDTIAYEVFERGLQGDDPQFLFWWIGLDEQADFEDRAQWLKVNPAPWITLEFLERERRRLPLEVFARLYLNAWTAQGGSWLPPGTWARCRGPVAIADGDAVHGGIDIGVSRDRSGVCELRIVGPERDEQGELVRDERVTVCRCGDPVPGDPEQFDDERAERCVNCDGRLDDAFEVHVLGYDFPPSAAGGQAISFDDIAELARDLNADRLLQAIGFDPAFGGAFLETAQQLADDGVPIEHVAMGNNVIVPAAQLLYDLVLDRRIVHDGDAILAQHVANAVVRQTEYGPRPSKARSRRAIDLLIALLVALHLALEPEPPEPPEPDIRFFD